MFKLQPGDVVRFYEIIRLLDEGQGGMSAVYEARLRPQYQQPGWPPRMALKVALPAYEDRLRAEADYLRRFDHPNVVKVFRIPKTTKPAYVGYAKLKDRSEVVYMAMEFLNGGSLAERLDRRRRLPLREVRAIACDLAQALQHIHSRQIINLDVKPENILFRGKGLRWLGRFPDAVLCDFGIARDLRYPRFGEHAATIPFAAPEQITYGQSDPARMGPFSDVFQWGVVVYLMITGELPFGPDVAGLVDPQRAARSMRESRRVPSLLDDLVLRALNKNPVQRYQNVDPILRELEQIHLLPASPSVVVGGLATALAAILLFFGRDLLPGDPAATVTATTTTTAMPTAPVFKPSVLATDAITAPASIIITPTATPTVLRSGTPTRRPTSTTRPTSTPAPTAAD